MRQCRDVGVIPIIGLCYANNYMSVGNYELTKTVNLFLQVNMSFPTANFLGSIDTGSGKWADGHWNDAGHPNDNGQTEMYYSIVPSLFDALQLGKPPPPARKHLSTTSKYLRLSGGVGVSFSPSRDDTIHSFSVFLDMRCGQRCECDEGVLLGLRFGGSTNRYLYYVDGRIEYRDGKNNIIESIEVANDAGWKMIALTHFYARGESIVYIHREGDEPADVKKISANERLSPLYFGLGVKFSGMLPAVGVECRNLLVYRSGLNELEVTKVMLDSLIISQYHYDM